MEAISQKIQKAWESHDYQSLVNLLTDKVEYISLSADVFLGGKSKVSAYLRKAFMNLRNSKTVTVVNPYPGSCKCFEAMHRYVQLVPELNYWVKDNEIYYVVALEPRESVTRVRISFEIIDSKIDLILVEKKEKTRRKLI
ncbi:MAG: hypothetical protein KBC43_12810 [Bacteroidales bacterium]|nr:hypothetical protein [Bacteroidales bacterium]